MNNLKIFADPHIIVMAIVVNVLIDCLKEAFPVLTKKVIRLLTFVAAIVVGGIGCKVGVECDYALGITAVVTGVDAILLYDYGGYGIISEVARKWIKGMVKQVEPKEEGPK